MDSNYRDNTNYILSSNIISFLESYGVKDFCLAPGSRSAPFALAISDNPKINEYIHFDERALAFFALGLAKTQKAPVAIITTSGSAVANLFPALMEAYVTDVRLIIISADRPYELLNCGANQTCMQNHIFGDYALFSHIPSDLNIPFSVIANQLDSLLYKSKLLSKPIHLNVEMREPLYSSNLSHNNKSSILTFSDNSQSFNINTLEQSVLSLNRLIENKHVIFIAGSLNKEQAKHLLTYANYQQIPVLADIQSNMRGNEHVYGEYELFLNDTLNLDDYFSCLVIFGGRLISKKLLSAITSFKGQTIWVNDNTKNLNATGKASTFVHLNYYELANIPKNQPNSSNNSRQLFADIYKKINLKPPKLSTELTELSAVYALNQSSANNLFIGNSLISRYSDLLLQKISKSIFSNRGVSGIDGQIATAAGLTKVGSLCAVIGDTTALYDLSSISLLKKYPMVLIIFNNNGGNIFAKFPISDTQKLNKYFVNPQCCQFEEIAKMFNINYSNPTNLNDFTEEIKKEHFESLIIELNFPQNEGIELYQTLISTPNKV